MDAPLFTPSAAVSKINISKRFYEIIPENAYFVVQFLNERSVFLKIYNKKIIGNHFINLMLIKYGKDIKRHNKWSLKNMYNNVEKFVLAGVILCIGSLFFLVDQSEEVELSDNIS